VDVGGRHKSRHVLFTLSCRNFSTPRRGRGCLQFTTRRRQRRPAARKPCRCVAADFLGSLHMHSQFYAVCAAPSVSVAASVVCLSVPRQISKPKRRKLSEIGAKFRRLYTKSGSPSKNMTSDFAPEVAKYLKSSSKTQNSPKWGSQ